MVMNNNKKTVKNTHLPSPEEGVSQGVQACESEVEQPGFCAFSPVRGIFPNATIASERVLIGDTAKEESTVVKAVTIFTGCCDTKAGTAKRVHLGLDTGKNRGGKMTHLLSIIEDQREQACPGHTPPAPSPTPVSMGSVAELPSKAMYG